LGPGLLPWATSRASRVSKLSNHRAVKPQGSQLPCFTSSMNPSIHFLVSPWHSATPQKPEKPPEVLINIWCLVAPTGLVDKLLPMDVLKVPVWGQTALRKGPWGYL
jgi:hypothetical protein